MVEMVKKTIVFFLLFGCTGVRSLMPASPTVEQFAEIQTKRHLRVAIVAETEDEGMRNAVHQTFETMNDLYGVGLGAYTFIPVDLSGVKTHLQMYNKVGKQISKLDSLRNDIFIIFSQRILLEDLLGILSLGSAEEKYNRFVFVRVRNSLLLQHELEHILGAKDAFYPEQNLEVVLKNKWRTFE